MTFDDDDNRIPIQIDQKVVQTFGQVVYLKAIAQSISSPSHTLDIPPRVAQDGGGLASTIAYLMTYLPEQYRLIEEDLKTIAPLIERVRVQPARITVKEKRTISSDGNLLVYDEDRRVIGHELIFDTKSGSGLPASMMSEGTLVALAILSIFHTSSNASLIMFDDIEQALHPLAQRCLVQILKRLAGKQNNQILFTTHSPYIVDELEAKDVWVLSTDKEGVSHCKRLSDHPDAERALQVLTTGEFLGAEGEDWVVPENTPTEEAHA
jgi:predicted ATPase